MSTLRAACLQMRSGIEINRNIAEAINMMQTAAAKGADIIATPEMTALLDIRPGMARSKVTLEHEDTALKAFCEAAKDLKVWLLIGSLAIALPDDTRLANRSFLIAPDGQILSRYDKIHMFDVAVGDGQNYQESRSYRPGKTATCCSTDIGTFGLTICYDLRFPQLYRTLAKAGAEIISCPAAFTRTTGDAHWYTLVRARAIETGAFLLAPAQGGKHEDGRETFGHSLIISPWGKTLAEAKGIDPEIIFADINLEEVVEARRRIPSLNAGQVTYPID